MFKYSFLNTKEYIEGLGDDLDLLIVGKTKPRVTHYKGGFYGTGGRRGGKISHFMLGVPVPADPDFPSAQPV